MLVLEGRTVSVIVGLAALASAIGIGCSESTTPDAAVASVVVVPATATVTVGSTTPLGAAALDADGGRLSRTISWSSSDQAVATVVAQGDSVGIVTGVSLGSATITATSEGKSGSATVTVTAVPIASITVTPDSTGLAIGDSTKFTATAKDSAGSTLTGRTMVWSTADTAVATVSLLGWARGKSAGTTTVLASAEGKSGSAKLTVTSTTPPPGPDEPVFQAGQDTSYFFDGFEAFTSSADLLTYQSHYNMRWTKNGATTTSNAILTTTGAFEGSKAVRFIYSGTGGAQQDVLIESLTAGLPASEDVVLVTFYLRTQPGYAWTNPSGNTHKIFLANIGGAGTGTRIAVFFGLEPLTPSMPAYGTLGDERPNISIGNNNYNQNLNYDKVRTRAGGSSFALDDGSWHRYTIRLTKSTNRPTQDTGNGRIEVWVDGVKIIEYLGDVSNRPEYGLVSVPSNAALGGGTLIPNFHFPSVRNADTGGSDVWIEYDAVRIWVKR